MKKFLLYTLATVTGIFLVIILFFFIAVSSVSVMIASGDKQITVKDNSLLVINTSKEIPERTDDNPLNAIDFKTMTLASTAGLNDVLKNLEKAAVDPKIKGILIENDFNASGWATLKEVRDALEKFKKTSGKFIIAYTDNVTDQSSYYLSSVADSIFINPSSTFDFKGLSGRVMFYKNALEKFGVDVQVLRHGKFKGAVEPFLYDRMSNENREQIKSYTGSLWNYIVEEISESRGITVKELNSYADNLSAYQAEDALKCKLVDGLAYRTELINLLKEKMNIAPSDNIHTIKMAEYTKAPGKLKSNTSSKNKISVIYASGNIVDKEENNSIAGEQYAKIIRKERKDSTVKAIVLRVNSPGGSALASDIIWHEVKLAAEKKPVIVSMGNYAASGGYYISAAGTKIFADPLTITGSIGVYGLIPNAGKLLEQKLGITTETVNTNKYSGFPNVFEPLSSYEEDVMQRSIENVYDKFVAVVSEGRSMTYQAVDDIAQGRVWSGSKAREIGLVDEMGGIEDAVAEAVAMAGITDFSVKELPEIEDTYTKLMNQITGQVKMNIFNKHNEEFVKFYNALLKVKDFSGIQARLPFYMEVR